MRAIWRRKYTRYARDCSMNNNEQIDPRMAAQLCAYLRTSLSLYESGPIRSAVVRRHEENLRAWIAMIESLVPGCKTVKSPPVQD